MAFSKNWRQFIVSKGEPFTIEYLNRAFGGRLRTVFKVDDDGVLTVNGQELNGTQNIVGDLSLTGDADVGGTLDVAGVSTLDDLDVVDDLTVGGTSVFTGAVTLPADTVTGAQLDTVLAAQIPMTATLTVGALVGDGREVTIQVKDAGGVNMAIAGRYSVWLSDTSKGSPIGQVTTGLTTTITDGDLALTKLANMDFDIISNADGTLAVTVTDTNGTQTRYLMISVNGAIYASAAIVTT